MYEQAAYNKPAALASCFHWAVFCYNVENARRISNQYQMPDNASILKELDFSNAQARDLLKAREVLLRSMIEISSQRQTILSNLGLESASLPSVSLSSAILAFLSCAKRQEDNEEYQEEICRRRRSQKKKVTMPLTYWKQGTLCCRTRCIVVPQPWSCTITWRRSRRLYWVSWWTQMRSAFFSRIHLPSLPGHLPSN